MRLWQEIFSRANTFDKTVSSGLFLSTKISWNTEPQANWKSLHTRLNDLSSPSLSFAIEYSNRGLWHSLQVTIFPTFNSVCADVEKGIPWPLLERFSSLEGLNFSSGSSPWSKYSLLSPSLCGIGSPKLSIISFPLTGKWKPIIGWAFKDVEVISTPSGMSA